MWGGGDKYRVDSGRMLGRVQQEPKTGRTSEVVKKREAIVLEVGEAVVHFTVGRGCWFSGIQQLFRLGLVLCLGQGSRAVFFEGSGGRVLWKV